MTRLKCNWVDLFASLNNLLEFSLFLFVFFFFFGKMLCKKSARCAFFQFLHSNRIVIQSFCESQFDWMSILLFSRYYNLPNSFVLIKCGVWCLRENFLCTLRMAYGGKIWRWHFNETWPFRLFLHRFSALVIIKSQCHGRNLWRERVYCPSQFSLIVFHLFCIFKWFGRFFFVFSFAQA